MRRSTVLVIGLVACASRLAAAQEPAPPDPAESVGPPEVPGRSAAVPAPLPPRADGDYGAPPPRTVYMPAQPVPPPARPAWRPRDAHIAIGVEHLLAFEALLVETNHDETPDGFSQDFTRTRSEFPFSGDRGGPPRLAVDFLFGGTVGAYVGYGRGTSRSVTNDPILGRVESPETGGSGGVAGLRGGAIIGSGATVALWLRGGVGYAWSSPIPSGEGSSTSSAFLALDPVLIIAPLSHLALTFGPYIEGSRGSWKRQTMGVTEPGESTWLNLAVRFTTNVSVMF
jgi:hypothetical protein